MEVTTNIGLSPVAGDQTKDSGKPASASPTMPSPEHRSEQVPVSNSLDLWPESQNLTMPKPDRKKTTNNTNQKQVQFDLTLMRLEFSKDKPTGKIVVKIIDQNTDKVIRQVPPQEFLDIVHNMNKAAKELLKRLPKTI